MSSQHYCCSPSYRLVLETEKRRQAVLWRKNNSGATISSRRCPSPSKRAQVNERSMIGSPVPRFSNHLGCDLPVASIPVETSPLHSLTLGRPILNERNGLWVLKKSVIGMYSWLRLTAP